MHRFATLSWGTVALSQSIWSLNLTCDNKSSQLYYMGYLFEQHADTTMDFDQPDIRTDVPKPQAPAE